MSSYAPLHHAIWEDDDFRALTPEAKLVYILLFSHRKLSRCGVLDLMPTRWTKATGLTPEAVDEALGDLCWRGFVLIDQQTEELAVRTKVKNDEPGSWTQVKSVWRAWEQIESVVLREWLLLSFPPVCWEHEKAPAPCDRPSDTPCHTPSDTPYEGATDSPGRVTAPSTLHPHPAPCTAESFTGDNKTEMTAAEALSTAKALLGRTA